VDTKHVADSEKNVSGLHCLAAGSIQAFCRLVLLLGEKFGIEMQPPDDEVIFTAQDAFEFASSACECFSVPPRDVEFQSVSNVGGAAEKTRSLNTVVGPFIRAVLQM
jgi:acyl carrier protein